MARSNSDKMSPKCASSCGQIQKWLYTWPWQVSKSKEWVDCSAASQMRSLECYGPESATVECKFQVHLGKTFVAISQKESFSPCLIHWEATSPC